MSMFFVLLISFSITIIIVVATIISVSKVFVVCYVCQ